MRGSRDPRATMVAFMELEDGVPNDHPLRTIKAVAVDALERLSAEFDRMYSKVGPKLTEGSTTFELVMAL